MKGKEEIERSTAVDEGGPTREFLSQIWQQMGNLAVSMDIPEGAEKDVDLEVGSTVMVKDKGYSVGGTVVKINERDFSLGKGKKAMETYNICLEDGGEKLAVKRNKIFAMEVRIKLFERQLTGFVPSSDEKTIHDIERTAKRAVPGSEDTLEISDAREKLIKDTLHKMKKFYCAIGRIMIHCLATDHPISSVAMPRFYQNGE